MDRTDYEEPRCPMDVSMWEKRPVTPIPAERVLRREDEYLAKNDYSAAERHLLYWWEEAEQGYDARGKLLLSNELMGLYRKTGRGEQARRYAEKAQKLTAELGLSDSLSGAVAFLNAGTVYKAFGEPEKALPLFERARAVYEKETEPGDERRAGLYNNMALALADLGRFQEAGKLYSEALKIAGTSAPADAAVTWLNLADCEAAEKGEEEAEPGIRDCLEKAEKALDSVPSDARGSYYAYVCEKCVPVFDYYGYFAAADKFRGEAVRIRGLIQ